MLDIRPGDASMLSLLIRAKRAMGRPRDLYAVLELEALRKRLREN